MVHTKELKPAGDVVQAIQASDDGATALPSAEVLQGATREIGNKLAHEQPQKPSELPEGERAHGVAHDGAPQPGAQHMSSEDKHLVFMEAQHEQQKAPGYDRSHPGAGHAGKGDQAISSAAGISRDARKQQGA